MRYSGYFGLLWPDSGVVTASIAWKAKQSWLRAIREYDDACERMPEFSMARLGYDPQWDFEKKKRWIKKRGAKMVKISIVVEST
jgi:hypothetical protein